MTERIRTLPDAELAVMQAVWACEAPAKRAQLAAILDKTHPMAPTTLLTVLSRLADKGFLRIEKQAAARNTGRWSRGRRILPGRGGNSMIPSAAGVCPRLPPRCAQAA